MSLHDYQWSKEKFMAEDVPFYGVIMLAMRKADTDNAEKLRLMWPEVHAELQDRYNAPGGKIASERENHCSCCGAAVGLGVTYCGMCLTDAQDPEVSYEERQKEEEAREDRRLRDA
jgi:hypothetical protein